MYLNICTFQHIWYIQMCLDHIFLPIPYPYPHLHFKRILDMDIRIPKMYEIECQVDYPHPFAPQLGKILFIKLREMVKVSKCLWSITECRLRIKIEGKVLQDGLAN